VILGNASALIDQPEFASTETMRTLLSLTDREGRLRAALAERRQEGLTVTIGGEHQEPGLAGFTLVTATYRRGGATGVIGVLGPTRMPYEKIVGLVEHTGRLIEGLIQ
jgi:heat-inducible transcriptional repressor